MTVLGRGDLSPPRRHGRRRGRRALVVLLIVAILGAGGWFGWRWWRNHDNSTVAAPPGPCSTPTLVTPTAALRPFDVLNGTLRQHLARVVAARLRRTWHLPVRHVGNTARLVQRNSVVVYPPSLEREARLVAAHVVPTARLVARPTARVVQLELGAMFRRLAGPIEFRAAVVRLQPSATPSPTPSPCASPS